MSIVTMRKGKFERKFLVSENKELLKEGDTRELTCAFATLYAILQINGWKEVIK
jgi:hypothetical protein